MTGAPGTWNSPVQSPVVRLLLASWVKFAGNYLVVFPAFTPSLSPCKPPALYCAKSTVKRGRAWHRSSCELHRAGLLSASYGGGDAAWFPRLRLSTEFGSYTKQVSRVEAQILSVQGGQNKAVMLGPIQS